MPPKYLNVPCSTKGCDRIAKQTSDTPYCRNCQISISKKRLRHKNRESKKKYTEILEFQKPLSDEKIVCTIYNELMNPRKEIWEKILIRISTQVSIDINRKTVVEIDNDTDDYISPIIDDTNMFPDCSYSNAVFRLLLLMRNTDMTIQEKQTEQTRITLEF
jgi:hypothetical protein